MIDSLLNYKLTFAFLSGNQYEEVKNKIFSVSNFPRTRMRRNRMTAFSRKLVKENSLSINDLIYPIFVTYGSNVKKKLNQCRNL